MTLSSQFSVDTGLNCYSEQREVRSTEFCGCVLLLHVALSHLRRHINNHKITIIIIIIPYVSLFKIVVSWNSNIIIVLFLIAHYTYRTLNPNKVGKSFLLDRVVS